MDEDVHAFSDSMLDKIEVFETANPLNPADTDPKVPKDRQGDDLPTSILEGVNESTHMMANSKEEKGEKEGNKAKRKKGTHAHSLAAASWSLVRIVSEIRKATLENKKKVLCG
jgi:hypothetical protein